MFILTQRETILSLGIGNIVYTFGVVLPELGSISSTFYA
jgi:hypothetical protein